MDLNTGMLKSMFTTVITLAAILSLSLFAHAGVLAAASSDDSSNDNHNDNNDKSKSDVSKSGPNQYGFI